MTAYRTCRFTGEVVETRDPYAPDDNEPTPKWLLAANAYWAKRRCAGCGMAPGCACKKDAGLLALPVTVDANGVARVSI